MRLYTTERLGPSQSLTPEGYLLCADTPIARTGQMLYAAGELPVEPGKDGLIRVSRNVEDVFRPETVASFVGKPITDDHPADDVTPATWRKVAVGTVQNVRQGEGAQDDLLIADLLITDPDAIAAVRAGKREVSCGYDFSYEETEPGRGQQRNIVGNHVALVERGRCGPVCAIGDTHMTTKTAKRTVADRLRAAFMGRDADEMEAALKEAGESSESKSEGGAGVEHHVHVNIGGPGAIEKPVEKDETEAKDEDPNAPVLEAIKALTEQVAAIGARMDALEQDDDEEDESEAESDEDGDDEKKEAKAGDKGKGRDSAALRGEFQDTMARAEILAPGIKLPAFDAKAVATKTSDALCGLRRRALDTAYATDNGKSVIAPMLPGKGADFKRMSCEAVKMMFNGASEMLKRANDSHHGSASDRSRSTVEVPTIAEINRRNAEFWAKR